jgi:hypothetical protein
MAEPMSATPMPNEVRALLPLVEVWGIPDDIERSLKVEVASPQDLRELVERAAAAEPGVYAWLEAAGADPSDPDYVTVPSLVMAVMEARVLLRNLER